MTSISDRCKTAREESSSGLWKYEEHKYCPYAEEASRAEAYGYPDPDPVASGCSNPTDPECDSCQTRYEVNGHPDGVWAENPPYHEANPADMRLAALAPEAADEVVRLTDALEDLAERFGVQIMRANDLNNEEMRYMATAAQAMIWKILNPGDTND